MLNHDQNDRPIDAMAASAYCESKGYSVAPGTLSKLRCIGGGPSYLKQGRRVRYRPSALDEWMASRTRELRNTSHAA